MAESNTVPPVPYKSRLTNASGFLDDVWAKWFQKVFGRIGGPIALSNLEIQDQLADITTLQAAVTALQTSVTNLQSNINDLNQGPRL